MKKLERLMTVCGLLVSSMLILRFAWVPYRANLALSEIQARTQFILAENNRERTSPIARENIELLDRALKSSPDYLQMRVLRAANLRILSRLGEAIEEYQTTLDILPTPVTIFDLGTAQIQNGQDEEGFANLVKAAKAQPSAARGKVDLALENRIAVALGKKPRTAEDERRSQAWRERAAERRERRGSDQTERTWRDRRERPKRP